MIFLVGIIGVLIMLALGVMVLGLILALVWAAVAIGAAVMAGVTAGMLATAIAQSAQLAEPAMLGVPVGIAVFLAVAALLLRRMFNVRTGAKRLKVKVRNGLPEALPEPEPVERDAKVREAWTRARDLVPDAALAQVVRARADCAALLDMADGDMLDPALIDLAAMLRRNVPALVQQVDALWRTSSRAEQAELGQGLAEDLVRMGAAARPFVDRRRETLRDGLAALRNHVAAQTRE